MNPGDNLILSDLRNQTAAILARHVPQGSDVALVQIPNQRNVGDALIWAGEIEYFRRLGLNVRYATDSRSFNADTLRSRLGRTGTILIHGGGNVGDLWPGQQREREMIALEFRDRRIVQLPQSVLFEREENAVRANEALGSHPNLILLARDYETITRSSASLPDIQVEYCPDMAFGWNAPTPRARRRVSRSPLILARADKEASSGLALVGEDWLDEGSLNITDWHNAGVRRRSAQFLIMLSRINAKLISSPRPTKFPQFLPEATLASINRVNIAGGVALFRDANVAVADRLHAHIMCVLLGIPHVIVDNMYRKIGSVYDAYSGAFSTAHYETSLQSARSTAMLLLETS